MMVTPTPRQAELLDFLRAHIAATGTSPTFDEMRTGIGASSKGQISFFLGALEERGHIRRARGRSRAIEVLDGPAPAVDLNRTRLAAVLRERFAGLHRGFELTAVQALVLADGLRAEQARFVEARR